MPRSISQPAGLRGPRPRPGKRFRFETAYGPYVIAVRNILVTYTEVLKRMKRKAEAQAAARRAEDLTRRLQTGTLAPYLVDARLKRASER